MGRGGVGLGDHVRHQLGRAVCLEGAGVLGLGQVGVPDLLPGLRGDLGRLTDRGRELSALLLPLMNWIIAYAPPQPATAPPDRAPLRPIPGLGADGSRSFP